MSAPIFLCLSSRRAGMEPWRAEDGPGMIPPHHWKTTGIWGFLLIPMSRLGRGMPMPSPGMWERTRAVGSGQQQGTVPRHVLQQRCLGSSLPSVSFCPLLVPPSPTLPPRSLFPASRPFLSNAGRENWCEIKKASLPTDEINCFGRSPVDTSEQRFQFAGRTDGRRLRAVPSLSSPPSPPPLLLHPPFFSSVFPISL